MTEKINFTEEQKEEIVRLYEKEFLHPREVGKKFCCSETPIYRILKEKKINTNISHREKVLIKNGKRKILRGKEHGSYGKKPHNFL